MIKTLDLIFCRLLHLYRKEKEDAINSASNYLTVILLVVPMSIIGSIVNICFRPENGWGFDLKRGALFLIVAPIFFFLSYYIKKIYKRRIATIDVKKYADVLKFNLFTLWLLICLLALLPVILPKML